MVADIFRRFTLFTRLKKSSAPFQNKKPFASYETKGYFRGTTQIDLTVHFSAATCFSTSEGCSLDNGGRIRPYLMPSSNGFSRQLRGELPIQLRKPAFTIPGSLSLHRCMYFSSSTLLIVLLISCIISYKFLSGQSLARLSGGQSSIGLPSRIAEARLLKTRRSVLDKFRISSFISARFVCPSIGHGLGNG